MEEEILANTGVIGAGIACIVAGFFLRVLPVTVEEYTLTYGGETLRLGRVAYPFEYVGVLLLVIGLILLIGGAFAGAGEKKVAPTPVPSPQPIRPIEAPAPTLKIIRCQNCGAENPSEAVYCHECGNQLRS